MRFVAIYLVVLMLSGCGSPAAYKDIHSELVDVDRPLTYSPHIYAKLFDWHKRSGRPTSVVVTYSLLVEKVVNSDDERYFTLAVGGYQDYIKHLSHVNKQARIKGSLIFEAMVINELTTSGLLTTTQVSSGIDDSFRLMFERTEQNIKSILIKTETLKLHTQSTIAEVKPLT